MVPVLLVTGPPGVGKTAVLREADVLLTGAGVCHATVELEEIARCWPAAIEGERPAFVHRNLAALWSSFVAVGASRLLVSALLEDRSDLRLLSDAVPDAAITVARLDAPLSTLERRITLREPGPPEPELEGARWWTQRFTEVRVEDYVVATADRPLRTVALEMLRLAGWLG